MLAGAPAEMKNALGLGGTTFKVNKLIPQMTLALTWNNEKLKCFSIFNFQYLNPASLSDPSIHDAEEFKVLEQSMDKVGLTGEEKANLFRVVAVVLHLGNISFEENSRDKKGR